MRRLAIVLTAAISAGGTALAASPHASTACPAIAGADAVLTPAARILVGEVHGTAETPHLVAGLACLAARHGAVRVGLEIPEVERASIGAYLSSAGAAADREKLLRGAFWGDRYQDGRRSQAVVELLEGLRRLRKEGSGADVVVVPYDGSDADNGSDRDLAMAKRLYAAFEREPKATFVVLSGNLHARKTAGRWKRTFMAARLVDLGVSLTTLDGRYGAGTAWVCGDGRPESCGPAAWGKGSGAASAVTLDRTPDGAYDGHFDVGASTFSPPAAVAMTEAQTARIALAKLRSTASVDYDAKRFLQCGDTFGDLARRDLNPRDDAYSAACCFALGGATARAFAALGDAVAHGYKDVDWLEKDGDLASLKSDPRWTALVSQLRLKTPAPTSAKP